MNREQRRQRLRTRQDFYAAGAVLLVQRDPPAPPPPAPGQPPMVVANPAEGPEVLLTVWPDGSVLALHGHVDMGQGIRTALAQWVAEELDVAMDQVDMVLGDTARVPNQGPTIASASLQIHAAPLRLAAAQARAWLMQQAAARWSLPLASLRCAQGHIHCVDDPDRAPLAYGELVGPQPVVLSLDPNTPLKDVAEHRVVGTPQPRVDIPAKAFGELTFVHDMRVEGMLHGRVVRPPYAGADHGDFIGNTLASVDEASIAHIPGIRAVVVIRDFIGIVADKEEQAELAAHTLKVQWKPWPGMPNVTDAEHALRNNPAQARRLVDEGEVDAALDAASVRLQRTYVWPYQLHASIGPSCALAWWQPPQETGACQLRVWAGTQNPFTLRADLSRLMQVADVQIDVVRMEAAGCYGRNCADDVAADAALLSRAVGAPVRVQLTREQEHLWEPKGAAQLMQVQGGLHEDGRIAAYDFESAYPSNAAPTLALLLTRTIEPMAQAFEMGDRTARPPYALEHMRITVNDMAPILRASWLRGVSALPNSFAHESFMDELATAAGEDPVAFRMRYLQDPRAKELLQATAERAGWVVHTQPQQKAADGDWLQGQGVAYARYVHSKWPGFGAALSAWVADVDVHRVTGEVHVKRVVVGHDAGLVINPAGVEHQIHGNVLQTTSRALKEQVRVDPQQGTVATREWGSYPLLSFREVPVIEVMQMPRPDQAPLGAGESSSVPGTAAIANAIFDATGVRFRAPPFTPEVVRAALHPLPSPSQDTPGASAERAGPAHGNAPVADAPWPKRRRAWWRWGSLAVGTVGVVLGLSGWRSTLAPLEQAASQRFHPELVARGEQLAALGNCVHCHTREEGERLAGGRAMHTPFGVVHTTNLSPDVETGIGTWSFAAFQRAMREGISRDGRHLYPAFPYTAFTHLSDDDLMALYAYFMSQPAVAADPAVTQLRFPFNLRPLMAGWNALHLRDGVHTTVDPTRSAQWNRGSYLVNALGHCGACHTERDWMGAERSGSAHLGGAVVGGWEAPSLTAVRAGPVPWSEQAFFDYLRRGHSAHHGSASGPMAEVVRNLRAVPDADLRAMAHYLASFTPSQTPQALAEQAQRVVAQAAQTEGRWPDASQRLFESACGACHHDGQGPRVLGVNIPLALNSNLHSPRPDNLLRVILEGVQRPPSTEVGFMPSFAQALDDAQLAELATYMRRRYAPDKPAWTDLPQAIARVRQQFALR